MATKVVVSLADGRAYNVRIGSGIIAALGQNLRAVEQLASVRRALVITDSNVAPLYLAQVKGSLSAAGFKVSEITVPAGEASKSVDVLAEIWAAMAQLGLGRDCMVVALGGGVVGDLAGFAAATYMRGVPVVQVPTTLLAMVDSSVGGKTAVNLDQGKNLVGAFWQPSFVCADVDTLATLPEREWRCGCGEIAKSAIVDSDDFFFWLCEHAPELAAHDADVASEAVARCVVFKANVVARDETETQGVRECLNYGHTLGHALEVCAGYGAFSHGEAVAEGMRFAARLAVDDAGSVPSASLACAEFAQAQEELLNALGLTPVSVDATPEELLAAMKHDKKVRDGAVRFVLVTDVAQWNVERVPDERILAALRSWSGVGARKVEA